MALPASVEGNWRLAVAADGAGQLVDAERYLRAVLDTEPDHLDARAALAEVLRARGDVAGAVAQSRQAFDRSGQHPGLGEALVWMLCEHGDRQGALDVAALLDDDEATAATLLQVARIDLTLGALTAAQLAAIAAAARAGTDERALADAAVRTQAVAARAAGDLPDARAALATIAAHDLAAVALQVEWMIDADEVDAALALVGRRRIAAGRAQQHAHRDDRRPDVANRPHGLAAYHRAAARASIRRRVAPGGTSAAARRHVRPLASSAPAMARASARWARSSGSCGARSTARRSARSAKRTLPWRSRSQPQLSSTAGSPGARARARRSARSAVARSVPARTSR